MISTKERVVTDLAELTEPQLKKVAEYLEFLKFRDRREDAAHFDVAEIETLYAEFADEDRELAEAGIADYALGFKHEDAVQ